MKYVYPLLPAVKNLIFFRIGGNGLANCMFVAARAYLKSKNSDLSLIEPTWFNLSLGTYLRRQSDKRHYLGLFNNYGSIYGIKKLLLLLFSRKDIVIESGLGNYFEDILNDSHDVFCYFKKITKPQIFDSLDSFEFTDTIAVHVRLGDYSAERRTSIAWYVDCIEQINNLTLKKYKFLLFSDGKDSELAELMAIPNVKRVFFGNSLADIWAISRTKFLIGSDSTFSAWGAYLGQVPLILRKCHFGRILKDCRNEFFDLGNDTQDRGVFFERVFGRL